MLTGPDGRTYASVADVVNWLTRLGIDQRVGEQLDCAAISHETELSPAPDVDA